MTDKVDIWPRNAALQRLFEAALTFKEIHGSFDYTTWLQQELAREIVVREHAASTRERIVAEAAAQHAANKLSVATEALEFYADTDNHKARNNQPSAVAKDRGHTAREALEMISGGNGDEAEVKESE